MEPITAEKARDMRYVALKKKVLACGQKFVYNVITKTRERIL